MPTIKQTELEKLSIEDIEGTIALCQTILASKRAVALDAARAKFAAECEALGVDLAGVLRKPRKAVAIKYRNANGAETWTGQGRTPLWMPKDKKNWDKIVVK